MVRGETQDPNGPDDSETRGLGSYESNEEESKGPPFYLTNAQLRLLGISGVGIFLNAYDLLTLNQVTTLLRYVLYDGNTLPNGLHGLINASANIGSVIGQFTFGYLADAFGRKKVYGKELMIVIFATILSISVPTGVFVRQGKPDSVLIWLIVWHVLFGIGVGGDYPMSASVSSDRTSVRRRGTMLAYVFANQGWGFFFGSLATVIVLAMYRRFIQNDDTMSHLDGAWRIIVGSSLIPAFGTLYQRLTLSEARRYLRSKSESGNDVTRLVKYKGTESKAEGKSKSDFTSCDDLASAHERKSPDKVIVTRKNHLREFTSYFSEWRHARILIGTCVCWFLLDVAFYGINLNQSVVLQQIGFGGTTGTVWHRLWETALGNLIITALGLVPGYYATVLTVEYLGRKWIQIQGFLMAALFLAILAAKFNALSTPAFVVCFALLQFFFNFGANTTTYLYPAEVFPTRLRASAHGLSAACGKIGAIISSLGFNALTSKIGTPNVLWIFFVCCLGGAGFTLLLPEVKGRDPDVVDAEEARDAGWG